jgi:hypothetical protein
MYDTVIAMLAALFTSHAEPQDTFNMVVYHQSEAQLLRAISEGKEVRYDEILMENLTGARCVEVVEKAQASDPLYYYDCERIENGR